MATDNEQLDRIARRVMAEWSEAGATMLLSHCDEIVRYHSHRARVPNMGIDDVAQHLRLEVFVALAHWDPIRGSFGPRVERFLRWEVSRLIHYQTTSNRLVACNCEEFTDDMVPTHDCRTADECWDRKRQILDRLGVVSDEVRETAIRVLLGWPYARIAQEQGITRGGVADRMKRFRAGLRWTR